MKNAYRQLIDVVGTLSFISSFFSSFIGLEGLFGSLSGSFSEGTLFSYPSLFLISSKYNQMLKTNPISAKAAKMLYSIMYP